MNHFKMLPTSILSRLIPPAALPLAQRAGGWKNWFAGPRRYPKSAARRNPVSIVKEVDARILRRWVPVSFSLPNNS